MTKINLAVTIDLDTELSPEVVSALTNDLVKELSSVSSKLHDKVMLNHSVPSDAYAAIFFQKLDEAKDEAKIVKTALENVAAHCEERASTFNSVAANWGSDDRDQAYGDGGIAAGYSGAAEYVREAIKDL